MRPDLQSARHAQHFLYRPAVDGLRGVAVLAVLGFHAFPDTLPGGYVGVDVFFVISGFLITGIIARQLRHGDFSFADFYWRRVRRLFPALALVLVATLSLGWLILLPEEYRQLGKHVAAAAAFVANFALWRETGYFDVAAELKPLLHLWSLGIEEQFYLAWPAMLVLLWKRRWLLLTLLAALVIGSFTSSAALALRAPDANFYSPASRFWELGAGCLLALLKEYPKDARLGSSVQQHDCRSGVFAVLPFVGFTLIAASLVVLDDTVPFPGWYALLPVSGTLLILATPEQAWFQRRVLGSRVLVWTGLISYALYLWHWPLLSFANIIEAGRAPATIRWLALASSFLLAWLTYRFLEIPVRRGKSVKLNISLAAAAAAAGIAGIAVYTAAGFAHRFDADVRALRHGPSRDDVCLARLHNDSRINYCRTTSAQPAAILFVGDSRAQAIYEGAAPLLAAEHSVMLLGRGGCPPLLNVRVSGYDPNEEDCVAVWRTIVRYIHHAKPKVVVIVGNGSVLIADPEVRLSRNGATPTASKEAVLEYGIRNLISELARTSAVIYLGEIPEFATAPSCFLRTVRLPTTQCAPELDRDQVEAAMAPYDRVLERVQTAFPDVQIVDALDVLCAADVCSQQPAGMPILYSDEVHLSPAGARVLVEGTELPQLISRRISLADAS